MQALFAITLLSFAGILWAALAFARHIKATQLRPASPEPASRHSFIPAITVHRDPEPARTPEPIAPRVPEPQPIQRDFREHFLNAPSEVPARNTRTSVLSQSVHDIAANKQFVMPPHATRIHRLPLRTIGAPIVSTLAPSKTPAAAASAVQPHRKPPQSTRQTRMELLDTAYFNKDMGDLSDPLPSNNLRANDRS
jgi:hypothetical protein